MRACAICGAAIERGRRCARCKRDEPANRYGPEHRRRRRNLEELVAGGRVRCARGAACLYAERVGGRMVGGLIKAGQEWELDHRDDGRGYLGPSHKECNQAAGRRRGREGRTT